MATSTPVIEPRSLVVPSLSAPSAGRLVPLALGSVYLIWGSTYLALKWMVEALPPLLSAGARYSLAGGILYAVMRLRGAPVPSRRQWLGAMPVALGLFVAGNGFIALSQREVSSSVAAIVCAAMPLLLAFWTRLAGEPSTKREILGLVLGFAGVVVMTTKELSGVSLTGSLILLAPIGWSLGSLAARKLEQPAGMLGAAVQMLLGGVAMFVIGTVRGEALPEGPIPMRAIGSFLYLVVAGALVGFSAFSYLLRHTRASVATSYAYVNPVIAVCLGVLLGGEQLAVQTVAGGVLVVLGVVVVVRSRT